ncbi:MAG: hypothetical protein AAGL24_17305 [Pseudomonadota bacterium]
MPNAFHYEEAGRRPVSWAALAVFVFLFWIAWTYDAPWFIWAIWLASFAMLAYLLIANPKSGLLITDRVIEHWAGRKRTRIERSKVSHVEIEEFSESTYVSIHLKDGSKDALFSGSVPPIPRLETALRDHGIATVRT